MKILAKDIKGYWSRGGADECPPGYFLDFTNLMVFNGYLQPRCGFPRVATANWNKTGYNHLAVFKPSPTLGVPNDSLIALRVSGGVNPIYNLTRDPLVAIYNAFPSDNFAWVNFFGRGYFSLHNTIVGSATQNVQVYENGAASRNACGTKPVSAMAGAAVIGGGLGVGKYLIDVCYVTSSGFITQPSGSVVAVDCFGSYSINLTVIPTGPAGTVARRIIMTKAIPLGTYTGNPNDYEFFFEPNGLINDNVTVIHTVNTFDGNLVSSADYLFNLLASIPSGVGMGTYNGRLLSWGESANPSVIRVSKPGDPESINATSGLLTVDPSEAGGIKNCIVLRNNLYIFKSNKCYVATDNGDEASTWIVNEFDAGVGTECNGVAVVIDKTGANLNQFVITAKSGMILFDGIVRTPELTYNIEAYWRALTLNSRIEVVLNPIHRHIYCKVYDSVGTGVLLVGDYSDGLTPETIKWYIWKYTGDIINAIIMINIAGITNIFISTNTELCSANLDSLTNSDSLAGGIVPIQMQSPPLFFDGEIGSLQAITTVKIRQTGGGSAINQDVKVQGQSAANSAIVGTLTTLRYVDGLPSAQTKWVYLPFVSDMPTVYLYLLSSQRPKISYIEVNGYAYGESVTN